MAYSFSAAVTLVPAAEPVGPGVLVPPPEPLPPPHPDASSTALIAVTSNGMALDLSAPIAAPPIDVWPHRTPKSTPLPGGIRSSCRQCRAVGRTRLRRDGQKQIRRAGRSPPQSAARP